MLLATLDREISLSDLPEGSILKILEGGVLTDFYVAKHNYESGLNGAGRTLLVRKDCYDQRAWHSSNANAYATSSIDSWLNGDYKALFSSEIQAAIGTTEFYYTPGNGDFTVAMLKRAIFLLSTTEFGRTSGYVNVEGTELPFASTLRRGVHGGKIVAHWTRSPHKTTNGFVAYINNALDISFGRTNKTYYFLPAFTLPTDAPCELNADGSYTLLL